MQTESREAIAENGGDGLAPARSAAASDKSALSFMIVVLGFGLCRAWIIFCLGAPLVSPSARPIHWVYLACGALTAIAIAVLCRKTGLQMGKVAAALLRIAPVALVASGVLIPLSAAQGSQLLMAASFVLGGVGAGSLQVLWGRQFAEHTVRFAAYASPAAAVVTAVVVALSAAQVNSMGYAVVPLLSYGLLVFHGRVMGGALGEGETGGLGGTSDEESDAEGSAEVRVEGQAPIATAVSEPQAQQGHSAKTGALAIGKLMFSIMVFSLLTRMFDTMSPADGWFSFLGGSAVFALVVVGIAFLAIVHKTGDRFNPTSIYRLSLPIMVAGYVAISLLLDAHAALSILIINVGYEFFDILTWVLFVDGSQRRDENAFHVFGLGVAFMFAGMAFGNTASQAIHGLVASGAVQVNMVAMVAVLCLVVIAFLVLPEGTMAQLSGSLREVRKEGDGIGPGAESAEADAVPSGSAANGGMSAEGRIERQCALVASAYKLTPRESEVIVLLAYGRTLAIIARDLQIAKGTARTHIESIYRKLGVHKQQELIDLVETFPAADAEQAPRS